MGRRDGRERWEGEMMMESWMTKWVDEDNEGDMMSIRDEIKK
jgi:hypothetical protein